jgi:hypothetical protein
MPGHQITTEIDIAADPEAVWAVLTDLGAYPDWNPFVVEAEADGPLAVGAELRVRLSPPQGRAITIRPQVTELEPGQAFEWHGRIVVPGLFDGWHRFELQPAGAGTRFTHGERFRGVLVPLLRRRLDTDTRAGFEAMNRALKDRVEGAQRRT